MSTKQKGRRREAQAEDIYHSVGYRTFRPRNTRFGDNDLFNLFDILAIPPAGSVAPVMLSQVKSNEARGIEQWVTDAMDYCAACVRVHFLVCHDGQGGHNPVPPRWRLLEPAQHVRIARGRAQRGENLDLPAARFELLHMPCLCQSGATRQGPQ